MYPRRVFHAFSRQHDSSWTVEMVEPLEETRSELIFATEPLLSTLAASIKTSRRDVTLVELDEIEVHIPSCFCYFVSLCPKIQKGILQLCKGLSFLHQSVKAIHSNINPNTVGHHSYQSLRNFTRNSGITQCGGELVAVLDAARI